MDRIDVLGDSNSRIDLFTKELLAETNDSELQEIVKKVATELNSPIALVSLVLDQVQFFKAHIGLPPVLESARGTHRDVSFCQFVVRDGKTFEVNDAPNDPRIPQHVVKEYNIKSYLGVPIILKENVMGSLCVLDTKKRGFSKNEHESLNSLAQLVNKRLEALIVDRRKSRLDLTEASLKPALKELSKSLTSIENLIKAGNTADTSIRTFINHSNHLLLAKSEHFDALLFSLEAAKKANQLNKDLLLELELTVKDGLDCVNALQEIILNIESTKLSKVLTAAQDLSRNATNLVGGFPLPELKYDPKIYTKGNFSIAIVTNCLLVLSAELGKLNSKNGIVLDTQKYDGFIDLIFSGNDFSERHIESAETQLKKLIGVELATLSIRSRGNKLILKFRTIGEGNLNNLEPRLQVTKN